MYEIKLTRTVFHKIIKYSQRHPCVSMFSDIIHGLMIFQQSIKCAKKRSLRYSDIFPCIITVNGSWSI